MTKTRTNPWGLTERELDILNHRLEVGDCIAEYLAGEKGYDEDAVSEIAGMLLRGDYDGACKTNREIANAVLADAVEGGTWNGDIDDLTPQQQAARLRVCDSLSRKISEVIGRHLRYPSS